MFDFIELSFEDNLTFLAGANNSGKTSLIEFFYNIFKGNQKLYPDDLPIIEFSNWKNDFFKQISEIIKTSSTVEEYVNKLDSALSNFNGEKPKNEDGLIVTKLNTPTLNLVISYDKDDDITLLSDYIMELDESINKVYFKFEYSFDKSNFISESSTIYEKFKKIITILESKEDSVEKIKIDVEILFKKLVNIYFESLRQEFFYCDKEFKILNNISNTSFTKLFNFKYIEANRKMDDQRIDSTKSITKKILSLISDEEDIIKKSDEIVENIVPAILKTNIKDTIENISLDKLNNVLKDIKNSDGGNSGDLKLKLLIEDEHVLSFLENILQASYDFSGNTLKEFTQGLGYSNLIYLYLTLEEFKKSIDLQKINFLFIEEPESHMHPQMQRVFIDYINKKVFSKDNLQGIITTHSSEFIKNLELKTIRVIRRKEAFKNIILDFNNFLSSKENNNQTKLYNTMFKINLSDIMFSDAIIIFEGDSEKIYLQRILGLENYNFLYNKYISFVQVGGAYTHRYYEFINFLRIKSLIITDIDYPENLLLKSDIRKDAVETTNNSLPYLYKKAKMITQKRISKLYNWDGIVNEFCCVKFQTANDGYARTFEHAIFNKIFKSDIETKLVKQEVKNKIKEKKIKLHVPKKNMFTIVDLLNSNEKGKTDFIYSMILQEDNKFIFETIPHYIEEGLQWLKN